MAFWARAASAREAVASTRREKFSYPVSSSFWQVPVGRDLALP